MRPKKIALTATAVLFVTLLWPMVTAFKSLTQLPWTSEGKALAAGSGTQGAIAEQGKGHQQSLSSESDGRAALYIFSSKGEPLLLFLLGVILLSAATCIKLKLLKRQGPEKRPDTSPAVEQFTTNSLPSGRRA